MVLPAGLHVFGTGAARGSGRELVASLVKMGARVVAHGRSAELVAETVRAVSVGGAARGVVADLSSLGETARLADDALAGGPIDILINNAGVGFGQDRTHR